MLQGWQIAKINASRKKNPYKQMKDRDMKDVEVIFRKHGNKPNNTYGLVRINQPSNKITYNYIANLGQTSIGKYWTHHGGGGWVTFVTMSEQHFTRMQTEVTRLGGKVTVVEEE